jgi:hypothetical protein
VIPKPVRAAAAALALLAAVHATPARAAAEGRIAVLEFTGKDVEASVLTAMTERARAAAIAPARRFGYQVMSRESAVLVLQEMGGTCVEGQCEIEMARSVGAALVLTGEVRRTQAGCLAELKLHDVAKGSLIAVEALDGKDEFEVLRLTREVTDKLLDAGFSRFFEVPVETVRPGAPSKWAWHWLSPGWNVAATVDQYQFSDGALANRTGGLAGLRVGWGIFGAQVGGYLPGRDRAYSLDLLREAGFGPRVGAWEFALLLPSLEFGVVQTEFPSKSAAAPAVRKTFTAAAIGLTGIRARYRKVFVSFRGPVFSHWDDSMPDGNSNAWSWAFSAGMMF